MPQNGYANDEAQNVAAQGAGENQEDLENEGAANATDEYPDDPDELKERLRKTEEIRDKNFNRMKEAQGFVKDKTGKWVKKEEPKAQPAPAANQGQKDDDNISTKDAMALMNASVTDEEDIDKVAKFAKLNGITIREALKDSVVKAILADSAEKRRTANATNTGKTRAGETKKSGEALLEKATKTGELPDNPEDLAKLAEQHLDVSSK